MLKICPGHQKVEAADSDETEGESVDEEADVVGARSFEQVPMLMNDRDFIYYVVK